jgi:beta-galactosidase
MIATILRLPRFTHCALLLLFALSAAFAARADVLDASARSGRERICIDAGWRFRLHPPVLRDPIRIVEWRWATDDLGPGHAGIFALPVVDTSGPEWHSARTGDDTFHGEQGYHWARTTLPAISGPNRVLHFECVDDNATVYLNGTLLMHHRGWSEPFDVSLDRAWNAAGPNTLAVLIQNEYGPGGITQPVTLGRLTADTSAAPARSDYDDHEWRVVHLPHDYAVEGRIVSTAVAARGFLAAPPAWYRRTFALPASDRGKSVWIDFDGVYRDARVYLNGRYLGEHPGGYTSFRYDISGVADYGGENVLAVSVDPRLSEGRAYDGAGIYRHVWLSVANPVHVAPWGAFVSASVDGDPAAAAGAARSATVTIQTTVANAAPTGGAHVTVTSRLVDDAGAAAGSASAVVDVPAAGSAGATQRIVVRQPRLWSIEAPHLYRLITSIDQDGRTVDSIETPFGIRSIRFDPVRGFFLNGKHVEIQGTCNRQDFAGVGAAVPDGLAAWRVQRLKSLGSNAWRTAGNPPAPELLDACDRLGMLVLDENRHLGDTYTPEAAIGTPYSDMSELDSMVERDRNHPSVILWSMGDEEPLQDTDEGARIFAAMRKETLRLDPTRPVTCGVNVEDLRGVVPLEDVAGFDYEPDVRRAFHRSHPATAVYGSAIGAHLSTRGVYGDDQPSGYVSAYDDDAFPWAQTAEDAWRSITDSPWIAGGFVWSGFDYRGEPAPYGWPDVSSQSGLLDTCGFLKDDAYYFQSVWQDAPMVHLLPHWNWAGKEGQSIDVQAYSNADEVELIVNGVSAGRKAVPRGRRVAWSVPYAAGTLEADAYADGKPAASDTVATAGAPAALRLSSDRLTVAADGEDVVPVKVDVVDAAGRIVPVADDLVSFHVDGVGRIVGVGNGNPTDHDPDKGESRHAFNGRCLVIVGAADGPGTLSLTATAPGLTGATLALSASR